MTMQRRAEKIEFFRHGIIEEDIAAATAVLRSIFLTTGTVTRDFEAKFSDYTGLPYLVALNSCTAALHLSLLAYDIGVGDEVIVPAMTFIATATAVMHTGATPVVVDCLPESGLIDPVQLERAVTSKTKAIVPVHLYGSLADMRAIRAIADRHGLRVIEDAAHCIEGERDGVRPGQLGDTVCYSFYATKNLACGEGGALGTKDPAIAEKVRILRTHGMSREAADRYTDRYQHWDMVALGWKYNPTDILSALLIRQLERLDETLVQRERVWERYTRLLEGMGHLRLPDVPGKSACHLFTIWVAPERRDEILHRLQAMNIGVAVNYRAIHTLRYFRENFGYRPESFPIAADIGARTISLPFYPSLDEEQSVYIAGCLREYA